jgi:hypothetical protein
MPNKPGMVVELESPPRAQDGEVLQLTLEDGRVLHCQVRDASPYCRVLGEKSPIAKEPDVAASRRPEPRAAAAIVHPCPRCLAMETVITHRGVTMTTLFCPVCRHGWGEAPSVIAAATRVDRRAIVRPNSPERRGMERVQIPVCTHCATDAYVRSVRRSAHEVYFVCAGCDAMWVRVV